MIEVEKGCLYSPFVLSILEKSNFILPDEKIVRIAKNINECATIMNDFSVFLRYIYSNLNYSPTYGELDLANTSIYIIQKNISIDKKIAAAKRVTGYILKIKMSNSGELNRRSLFFI